MCISNATLARHLQMIAVAPWHTPLDMSHSMAPVTPTVYVSRYRHSTVTGDVVPSLPTKGITARSLTSADKECRHRPSGGPPTWSNGMGYRYKSEPWPLIIRGRQRVAGGVVTPKVFFPFSIVTFSHLQHTNVYLCQCIWGISNIPPMVRAKHLDVWTTGKHERNFMFTWVALLLIFNVESATSGRMSLFRDNVDPVVIEVATLTVDVVVCKK